MIEVQSLKFTNYYFMWQCIPLISGSQSELMILPRIAIKFLFTYFVVINRYGMFLSALQTLTD